MINPRIARYMLAKHGRGGLPGLVHDNLADLGITPRPLDGEEDEGPQDTAINEAAQELDVPQQAALPGAEPEELEDYPQPFTAPPTVEAQAPVVASRATAEDDDEAGARRMDANTALARGFETAGRQFLAGMTRTPVLDTLTEQSNAVGQVRSAAKTRAEQLRAAAEEARRSRETDDKLMNSESSRILDLAKAAALSRDIRTGEDPNRVRALDLKEKEIASVADAKAALLQQRKDEFNAKPKGVTGPKPVRGIPEGYEENPDALPSEDGKRKFTELVLADQSMRGLTDKMRKVLGSVSTQDRFTPGQNASIKQLAQQIGLTARTMAKLGVINGPDIGIMDRLSGDPTSVFSLVKDTGALLDGLDAWGGNEVTAGQKAYGLRPKTPKGGTVVLVKDGDRLTFNLSDPTQAKHAEQARAEGYK